jgi:glutamyl-tRNA reductase
MREQVAFARAALPESLLSLVGSAEVQEAAILSTCNRTEIYGIGAEPHVLSHWLHKQRHLPAGHLDAHFYLHRDGAAVQHILRVASGLDSMALGEPQIFGQLKAAFSWARAAGTVGTQLRHLSQYIFSAAKRVRSETLVGAQPVSIAFAAAHLARHIFSDLSTLTVLLIGAGETIELSARHLRSAGVKHFYIANRTLANATKLAQQVQGEALTLASLADYLPRADIVIAATASTVPILGKGLAERALRIRKRRPMLMIDFAVPRNIEPEIAQLDDIYLYMLDDLQAIIQENQKNRAQAAQQAEAIIVEQAAHYMQTLKVLETAPLICAYRDKAEKMRDKELQQALHLLQCGLAPAAALERLAQRLTNKLLHVPTVKLRAAAYQNQTELLTAAQHLFEVEKNAK